MSFLAAGSILMSDDQKSCKKSHSVDIYNPPSKIRPGGTEAQQGYSIA